METDPPTERHPCVLVLGCGVNGLTAAMRLALDGFAPVVIGRDPPFDSCSVGAGALWEYPPFAVEPAELACRLALASRPILEQLSAAQPTGVVMRRCAYGWRSPPMGHDRPAWKMAVGDTFQTELEPEYAAEFTAGISYVAPVVYMRQYLVWLLGQCSQLGVRIFTGPEYHVRSMAHLLDELAPSLGVAEPRAALVVNCLALGAAEVFGDTSMVPVRGQLAYVYAPGVETVLEDSDAPDGLTYVVPQSGGVVACAGCAQVGDDRQHPDAQTEAGVLERCRRAFPVLRDAPVVGRWAGLRPSRRAGLRIETEEIEVGGSSCTVMHNYGHGGSGVILSWGSAQLVAREAAQWAEARAHELLPRVPPPELADWPTLRQRCEAAFASLLVPAGGHTEATSSVPLAAPPSKL